MKQHSLKRVLLQPEREVSEAYQAYGTPTAVVVGIDGLIASPVVGGAEAIGTLIAQATRPLLIRRGAPQNGNGHRNGGAVHPPPDSSRVGKPAPDLTLTALDGQPVKLSAVYKERTVVLFWNPGCGFCQRMLPDLRAFEDHSPDGSPWLVVISAGDADHVRQQDIHSTVLLDPDAEAMRAFHAGGTPMGVLIQDGRIASPVAAGADAVLQLAAASDTLVGADLARDLPDATGRDGTEHV